MRLPRKAVAVGAIVVALIGVGACKPSSGGGGGPDGGGAGGGPGSFMVIVTALDRDNQEPNRNIQCTVIGYGTGNKPVIVEDPKTGRTAPYSITVEERTPARLRIQNYANVRRIEVVCTMFARNGDAIFCEFLDRNGRVSAPLIGSVGFGEAIFDDQAEGFFAHCSAIINAAT